MKRRALLMSREQLLTIYKTLSIITGAIKSTSWDCLYEKLGLCDRRCYRKLVLLYKIVKGLAKLSN